MNEKLLIGLLGRKGAGRSYTWKLLFGRNVHTGKHTRKLFLNKNEYVDIFLVNGSPQERRIPVSQIIPNKMDASIVLCSFEYKSGLKKVLQYFERKNFSFFIQWLKPGFKEEGTKLIFYSGGIVNYLLSRNSTVTIRSGKENGEKRTQEIKEYIYGWAQSRNLIKTLKQKNTDKKLFEEQ